MTKTLAKQRGALDLYNLQHRLKKGNEREEINMNVLLCVFFCDHNGRQQRDGCRMNKTHQIAPVLGHPWKGNGPTEKCI